MKAPLSIGAAGALCALLSSSAESGAASVAAGVPIYSQGSDFQAYNASDVTFIDYIPNGVRTLSSNATPVIASVDHSVSTNGMSVYVDGFHWGAQTTTCTLYTFDRFGSLLSTYTSSAASLSGAWTLFFLAEPAGSVADRYLSVICTLPPSGLGFIRGITTNVN